jgi:hypothetical protein
MLAKAMFTGLAAAALALAQGGQGGAMAPGGTPPANNGGNMGPGMGNAPMIPMKKASKADLVADRLKLTPEQRSEMNTIFDSTFKDAGPVIQQLIKSRTDVANAMLNGRTEEQMAPLMQALSDAQFQMTGVEVKAFQRIVALLKPNQASKAPEAFDLMADIFLPQGGGRGRGR